MKLYVSPYTIDDRDGTASVYEIDRVVPHPKYNGTLNDIMLLKLKRPVTDVEPFRYNTDPTYPRVMDDPLTIVGFGLTGEGGNLSTVLRRTEVYEFSTQDCVSYYPQVAAADDDDDSAAVGGGGRYLCAGTVAGGRDGCDSDSGNPYLINGTVVAVTNDGIGCGRPAVPSINARVSGFARWIENSICSLSNVPPPSCPKATTKKQPPQQKQPQKQKAQERHHGHGNAVFVVVVHRAATVLIVVAAAMVAFWGSSSVLQSQERRRKRSSYQSLPTSSSSTTVTTIETAAY
jgi:secreted trypsin-like serine protease